MIYGRPPFALAVGKPTLVCAAWPYANAVMHLGHPAGYLLPADIFARYRRMKGDDVLFVSGSDEHGTPIMLQAEALGLTPAQVAEKFHQINSQLMGKYQISFDLFSRTSSPQHKEVVTEVFKSLIERGHIYQATMKAMYCPKDATFRADRYVEGTCPHCGTADARGDQCDNCGKILDAVDLKDPRCKLCKTPLELRDTEHFFFALSRFQSQLDNWLGTRRGWRPQVLNFTRNFVRGGLKDRAVTRDIAWGVDFPLPGFEGKKIYVWFEALLGYLSASREACRLRGRPEAWTRFWQDSEAESFYFLGKDNIPFHTVILPAVLMGLGGYNLPTNVPANEYLLFQGAKFSKSKGVGMNMEEYLELGEVAAIRYYLTVNMPELKDVEADWDDFVAKNNSELLGNLGNFVNRTMTLVHREFAAIPKVDFKVPSDSLDAEVEKHIEEAVKKAGELLDACEFKAAMKEVLSLSQFGNMYIDHKAPWKLAKENPQALVRALYNGARLVRTLAVLTAPFLPDKAQLMWQAVGEEGEVSKQHWDAARGEPLGGRPVPEPSPIIKPIDPAAFKPASKELPLTPSPLKPLDLRAGRIVSVKAHPKADRLYLVQVDLGDETRQVVAGLRQVYQPEELEGKTGVIVANLEPAKLRGEISQGMILAAEGGGVVAILTAEGTAPGALVTGCSRGAPTITIAQFAAVPLFTAESEDGRACAAAGAGDGMVVLGFGASAVRLDREVPAGSKIK
jgi:methionyl-tRNA synthetase